ncbi:hypothetical protein F511_40873 [Dorcoceras hygrometricum]|uniref:Uncharacterized protein n=1 Tax=Dorcoceras hygrometricum TaxID=472368 RepID=A0A2Z7ATQ2_9LAMI|nr:hypothetical protein F511_40873 [Dorcoceras hygrometricum]
MPDGGGRRHQIACGARPQRVRRMARDAPNRWRIHSHEISSHRAPPACNVHRQIAQPVREGSGHWSATKRPPCAAGAQAAVDRQSGPRPDSRHLCQPALEGLTNSAWTETPRQADRNKSDQRTRRRGDGTWAAARPREGARGEGRSSGLWRLGITDSSCKNQLVVVSVQYGPFNTYIPIRSTTIGKSRVARDPIAMHTFWRSNSDIASVTRVSMTFRVVRTNQYNQDLGLIHSTNGNHLKSPNEGSSIDHQVTKVSQLVEQMAQLVVPRELDRVPQLYILYDYEIESSQDKSPPKEELVDISPEELKNIETWLDHDLKAKYYMLAYVFNELQRRFDEVVHAADIHQHLKELFGKIRRAKRLVNSNANNQLLVNSATAGQYKWNATAGEQCDGWTLRMECNCW